MNALYYLLTRAILALVTLMSADAIADTMLAADPWNVLAAFFLIIVFEILLEANTQ